MVRAMRVIAAAGLFCVWTVGTAIAADAPLVERARQAMRKAAAYWAEKVASHGGFVWEYSTDFVSRRRGESKDLPLTTDWIQYPGTPAVGTAFLRAYEATGEQLYLDAAVAAAHCLAWGQLKSGGWSYYIEFDPRRNNLLYYHLDEASIPKGKRLSNTTTFDDDNTQSATRFLMEVDKFVDDPKIDAAIERALGCFLEAQYKGGGWDGAWPQRYPTSRRGYGSYPTFNDNTMTDCVRTMLIAYKQYGKQEYLDSVKRCLEFYLRSQQPEPQPAWGQQYADPNALTVADVPEWDAFCRELMQAGAAKAPSPGKRVWMFMHHKVRALIELTSGAVGLKKYNVLKDLNEVLKRLEFYAPKYFPGLKLPPEAKALLERRKELSPREVNRVNRLVLEAAYPQIAKSKQIPRPGWARRFEPPCVTGGESAGNIRLLIKMYVEFGDRRYLEAAGKAVAWFKRSRIGTPDKPDVWARFYEVGTNRPLYFTRTYDITYSDDDLPVHYSFKGSYGRSAIRRYERFMAKGRDYYLKARDHKRSPKEWRGVAKSKAAKAAKIIAAQDELGRWVKVVPWRDQVRDEKGRVGYVVDKKRMMNMLYSSIFIRNMRDLSQYIMGIQGGPKVQAAQP